MSTLFFADLFSFVLVSSDKLNLTVRVEDEFTYFATGRPLLAGAKVTLRSRLRSISITQYTNESGRGECERAAIEDRLHINTYVVAIMPTCRHFGCMTFHSSCHLCHVYTLCYGNAVYLTFFCCICKPCSIYRSFLIANTYYVLTYSKYGNIYHKLKDC